MIDKLKDVFGAMNPKNRIWPANHDDPRVKGPQPRILSCEAARELRRRQREAREDGLVIGTDNKGGI